MVYSILIISTSIYPVNAELRYGGIERLVWEFALELTRRAFKVTVAAPTGSAFPEGIRHIDTGQCGGFVEGERNAYFRYASIVDQFDCVLDFSHTHWAMLECKLPALAVIWHDPEIMKPLEPKYNICALSDWQADRFKEVYQQNCIVLSPICANAEIYKPSELKSGKFLIAGKIGVKSGIIEAIEMCKDVGEKLDIIGTPTPGDPSWYFDKMMKSCNNDITYLGEVADDAKISLMAQAKALLYPVTYPPGMGEAATHKGVEAMLCGTPVITYDQGGMREYVDEGMTGILVHSNAEFKKAMIEVNSVDRNLCRQMAVAWFSTEAVVLRWMPVIEKVAKGEKW